LTQRRSRLPPSLLEDAFSRAVSNAGGVLVRDLLPSGSDVPKNADYVFRDYDVIAELKILEGSALDRQKINDQFSSFVQRLDERWKSPPDMGN
jgi:hypothetical protein